MSQEKKLQNKEKEQHGPKIDTFFQKLPDDYLVKLYKYNGMKKEFIKDYINEVPENEDIRNKYGAGRYAILCYKADSNGKRELFDSVEVNLADIDNMRPRRYEETPRKDNNEEQFLQKLAIYKEIFSGNQIPQNNTGIESLVQLMTLQMQAQQQNAQLQSQQIQQLVDVQLKNMSQIQDMIVSQNKGKSGFSEIIEAVEFVDSIKGDRGESGNNSLVETFLKNPDNISNLISVFSKKDDTGSTESNKVSDQFPKEFVDKITRSNKVEMSKQLYELNKEKITEESASSIIEQILKEKGL